ncbi:hypothetical protein BH09SUM1_BH09SUM1_22270 [soil metagenome]
MRTFFIFIALSLVGICCAETQPHNLIRISDRIYSGAAPEGEGDFAAIRKLGANTIVSVDTTKPNVKGAHALGMKYIHIPLSYEGITRPQAAALSEAMEETTGTIYFHCDYGKLRGPAAAALAWRFSADATPAAASEALKKAGVNEDFKGLWAAMAMDNLAELRAQKPKLVETAILPGLGAHMGAIDGLVGRLMAARKAGWFDATIPATVDPAQDALMVQSHFHEIGRLDDGGRKADFNAWRVESEKFAAMLKQNLKDKDGTAANASLASLQQDCRLCHAAYRGGGGGGNRGGRGMRR